MAQVIELGAAIWRRDYERFLHDVRDLQGGERFEQCCELYDFRAAFQQRLSALDAAIEASDLLRDELGDSQ